MQPLNLTNDFSILPRTALSLARRATALAQACRLEKFSFHSEFAFSYRSVLQQRLRIPFDGGSPLLSESSSSVNEFSPDLIPPEIGSASSAKSKRTRWSVVIVADNPSFNYFPILLASVIRSIECEDSWEVLVADISENPSDVARMVREFSKYPIRVVRFDGEKNPLKAANECLRQSRGQLIHFISQDSAVEEKFYQSMGEIFRQNPQSSMAACHDKCFDYENVIRRDISPLEPSGFYRDVRFAAFWAYRLSLSSFVVRRSLYERLGGFRIDLGLWGEWDVRARWLSSEPLYFHQDSLCGNRLHSCSRRQRELRNAVGLECCAKAVSLAARYYPSLPIADFFEPASTLFAWDFVHFGGSLLTEGLMREGFALLDAAAKLCPTKEILDAIRTREFYLHNSQRRPEPVIISRLLEAEAVATGDYFPPDELSEIENFVLAYSTKPSEVGGLPQVRSLRGAICAHVLHSEEKGIQGLFSGNFAKVYAMLRECGISTEPEGEAERELEERAGGLLVGNPSDLRALLAIMLLCPAHWGTLPIDFCCIPEWMMGIYLDYLLASPEGFVHSGEADMYLEHLTALLAAVERDIIDAKGKLSPALRNVAFQVALRLNLIPAYFSQRDMKDFMRSRARVLAYYLEQNGYGLECSFSPRTYERRKHRVGFLSAHIGPQTETYTSVPSFYLDRSKFEIHLFVLASNPSAIEEHCREHVDSFTVLPKDLAGRVKAIRGAGLDVLVIGTNMTAVTNETALLGMHRLAPIQIASSSSPMTPGLPHLDGFLSGIVHGYDAYSGQYNERLLLFDGALSCLEYSVDRPVAVRRFTRRGLGIPDEGALFVSGANFFKIIPELQKTWAEILKRVPNSRLLLHPFNPNWTNRYPVARFRRDIARVFERAGVDPARVIISEETLPTRADVCELMGVGDVYLDSHPFSGSVSLVDPLEAGVPPVAWAAPSTRGLMAASMLSDLSLRELVAESEEEYIGLAVRLAGDPMERERLRGKIREGMAAGPRFYDVKKYGAEVSRVLEAIVAEKREVEAVPEVPELVRRAKAAMEAGRLSEVEDLCRLVVQIEPTVAAAWGLMAELAYRTGDLNFAADLITQALDLETGHPGFWTLQGEIQSMRREFEKASVSFRRALELHPNASKAWIGLGRTHEGAGEKSEAEQAYNKAIRHAKGANALVEAHLAFAGFLSRCGRSKEAIGHHKKAVEVDRQSVEAACSLAEALMANGQTDQAQAQFEKASRTQGAGGVGLFRWGKALAIRGEMDSALEKLAEAIRMEPENAEYFAVGGMVSQVAKRTREALERFDRAVELGGDSDLLHENRGTAQMDLGMLWEAGKSFARAIERDPGNVPALVKMGDACVRVGMVTEARECLDEALKQMPDFPQAFAMRGKLHLVCGRADEAVGDFREAMRLEPENEDFAHHFLFAIQYAEPGNSAQAVEEHREWGRRVAEKVAPRVWDRRRARSGKIRVGYVSGHLRIHPVAFFVEPLLAGRDRESFEVFVYSSGEVADVVTGHLRELADTWRDVGGLTDEELARMIEGDKIDILVDLGGHAVPSRLGVFARKPAPVQVAHLGCFATTGLATMDYRLTDAHATQAGAGEVFFTEQMASLPGCAWCYWPPEGAPAVGPVPSDSKGFVTFGSFGDHAKLNTGILGLWAKILQRVPNSRLKLKTLPLADEAMRAEVIGFFESRGIAPGRLELCGHVPSYEEHFAAYGEVDIALDSFPRHGTATTCEALWMGVPVISRVGETPQSRIGASLLTAAGLSECLAGSEEEYIEKAVAWATDNVRRRELRAGLRARLDASTLRDVSGHVRSVEEMYRCMVGEGEAIGGAVSATKVDSVELMQRVEKAFSEGRLADVEDLCRRVLEAEPATARAWHLLGVLARMSGDFEWAAELQEQAASLSPGSPEIHREKAAILLAKGETAAAVGEFRRVLELEPQSLEALAGLAEALHADGKDQEAFAMFQKALRLAPNDASLHVRHGKALKDAKRPKDAIAEFRRAVGIDRKSFEAAYELAVALDESGQTNEALTAFEKASKIHSGVGELWNAWSKCLLKARKHARAIECADRAIQCEPENGEYHFRRGYALQENKRPAEAIASHNEAIRLGMETAELYTNHGMCLQDLNRTREAATSFHKAIQLDPTVVSAMNNLGIVCAAMGMSVEAIECYESVIARRPDLPGPYNNIGEILRVGGRASEALAHYRKALKIMPDATEIEHNMLLCMLYTSEASPEELAQAHKHWGASVERRVRPAFKHSRQRKPGQKIRIGLISPDLIVHPVAFFVEPLLKEYDRTQFEMYVYSDTKYEDYMTERLKKHPDNWLTVAPLSSPDLAHRIYDDKIDILLDLTGHTGKTRLEMFSVKPAPVQASYLGYPATTGLTRVDYRITDVLADPPGMTEHLHTEKLVRLEKSAWCYTPHPQAPEVAPMPADAKGFVTFGSFNNLAKQNKELFALWAEILNRVPGSHLRLKSKTFLDEGVKAWVSRHFTDAGIAEDRLDFCPFAHTVREHLSQYGEMDISLDTYPYHGTTTTCDAAWMGVPVVSLIGNSHLSRVGASLLHSLGLDDLATDTPEAYVAKAVELANDLPRLRELRSTLRSRMAASPLRDEPAFARAMEAAFKTMMETV